MIHDVPGPMRDQPVAAARDRGRMLAIAYAALLLLGPFGEHRFYLGRWISGLLLCALTILCVGAILASIGTLVFSSLCRSHGC